MKFRTKPVDVEAMQWDGTIASADEIEKWSGGKTRCEGYGRNQKFGGVPAPNEIALGIFVSTPEGVRRADPQDWIVKGAKGEFYPCKPDVFAADYEPTP